MSDDELSQLIEIGKRQAGINDVLKLHQDHRERVNRNATILRTRHQKGILVTTSSTF